MPRNANTKPRRAHDARTPMPEWMATRLPGRTRQGANATPRPPTVQRDGAAPALAVLRQLGFEQEAPTDDEEATAADVPPSEEDNAAVENEASEHDSAEYAAMYEDDHTIHSEAVEDLRVDQNDEEAELAEPAAEWGMRRTYQNRPPARAQPHGARTLPSSPYTQAEIQADLRVLEPPKQEDIPVFQLEDLREGRKLRSKLARVETFIEHYSGMGFREIDSRSAFFGVSNRPQLLIALEGYFGAPPPSVEGKFQFFLHQIASRVTSEVDTRPLSAEATAEAVETLAEIFLGSGKGFVDNPEAAALALAAFHRGLGQHATLGAAYQQQNADATQLLPLCARAATAASKRLPKFWLADLPQATHATGKSQPRLPELVAWAQELAKIPPAVYTAWAARSQPPFPPEAKKARTDDPPNRPTRLKAHWTPTTIIEWAAKAEANPNGCLACGIKHFESSHPANCTGSEKNRVLRRSWHELRRSKRWESMVKEAKPSWRARPTPPRQIPRQHRLPLRNPAHHPSSNDARPARGTRALPSLLGQRR